MMEARFIFHDHAFAIRSKPSPVLAVDKYLVDKIRNQSVADAVVFYFQLLSGNLDLRGSTQRCKPYNVVLAGDVQHISVVQLVAQMHKPAGTRFYAEHALTIQARPDVAGRICKQADDAPFSERRSNQLFFISSCAGFGDGSPEQTVAG